ncbi:hypothetical protein [Paraburkholderia terrae]|uniref:DUF1841 domain-containing protein n=1 Tax=Paraburkholderia terrae TaxID=311230 RepID=A0ABM7U0P4_9BURK|nr:hypothetical protein [Paraburkholderia terrae]BCZ84901.1 hypothetical protein PTKU64_85760 [Paraburkholderia terrae]BDC44876.1 hypothetical protein PTKU15_81730 [Paraburkholderia terrae]
MEAYNPQSAPEPGSWLELDEQERIDLVESWHRAAHVKLPNVTAHAALHTVVENQIAMNLEPVVRAVHRLTNGGLTRHDAIHAIGSVVAEQFFDILTTEQRDEVDASQAHYLAAVERLTVTSWRQG